MLRVLQPPLTIVSEYICGIRLSTNGGGETEFVGLLEPPEPRLPEMDLRFAIGTAEESSLGLEKVIRISDLGSAESRYAR